MLKLVFIVVAMLLIGCQTNGTVYAPNDDSKATGKLEPITNLLKDDKIKRVRVVFVHGVNDHCPGYAIPSIDTEHLEQVAQTAWLNKDAIKLIGLHPRPRTVPFGGTTDVAAFMGDQARDEPAVRYRVREYDWSKKPVIFEAIEITWSPLTQSIKSNWLGYDASSVMDKMSKQADGTIKRDDCVPDPANDASHVARPLPRVYINRILKESTLDRALADAVIYVGSYGTVISHGVADALCHAITRNNENKKCKWPAVPNEDERSTRYIFVTHSLGSRIVFDIFRDLILTADEERAGSDLKVYRPGRFSREERLAANPFVSSMLERTSALYMMANQLPMLGLANIRDANLSVAPLGPLGASTETDKQKLLSGLEEIGNLRAKHYVLPTMQITAFHDTNDLLTWPLPPWYAIETNGGPIAFTNVYVNNSFRWLIFEHPGDAHVGYFSNGEVWRAISCGADDGKIKDC